MPRMSKIELFAAIRRDAAAGMSGRAAFDQKAWFAASCALVVGVQSSMSSGQGAGRPWSSQNPVSVLASTKAVVSAVRSSGSGMKAWLSGFLMSLAQPSFGIEDHR